MNDLLWRFQDCSTLSLIWWWILLKWFVRPIKPQGRPSDKWGLSLTKKRIPGGLLTLRKLPLSKEESKGALQDRFILLRSTRTVLVSARVSAKYKSAIKSA